MQENCWLRNNCKGLHCDDPEGCMILYKLNFLFDEANVSYKQRQNIVLRIDDDGTDLEEFKLLKNLQDDIINFVQEGKQLYIYSSIAGNGKSSWALRLLQTYFKKIWLKSPLKCRGMFISVPSLLLGLKDNITNKSPYIQHIKDNIKDCDLVIWDDIGSKVGTEFEINHLMTMIDSRINNGKANIYTSNIAPEDLGKLLDIRLGSRIANGSLCVQFRGGDKRNLMLEED